MVSIRPRLLVLLLLLMTVVTGLIDAMSYLALGRVFVANMTGNVVFVGFAWAGEGSLSARESLVTLAAFLVGATVGGRLAARQGDHQGRGLVAGTCACLVLLMIALVIAIAYRPPYTGSSRDALVVLLGLAMSLQSSTARTLGVADVTTTVLTMTLTALAVDSHLAVSGNPRAWRRIASVLTMLVGAAVGALLVLHTDPAWALAAAASLMLVIAIVAVALTRGTPATDWEASHDQDGADASRERAVAPSASSGPWRRAPRPAG